MSQSNFPYEPPKSEIETSVSEKGGWRKFAPVLGGCTGGCLIPFLLFIFCGVVLKDTGGPLIWPIVAVPLGLAGLIAGMVVAAIK